MQTSANTSLSLKFGSDFLLSTKYKLQSYIVAVESFVINLLSFLSLRVVLTLVSCPRVLSTHEYISISHCLKQF